MSARVLAPYQVRVDTALLKGSYQIGWKGKAANQDRTHLDHILDCVASANQI